MLSRDEREKIEKEGLLYGAGILSREWGVPLGDIEIVTDKDRQVKGIDLQITLNGLIYYVDTKHQSVVHKRQKLNEYGVDTLSIEVRKAKGQKGWGIDNSLLTHYLLYTVTGVGYYLIDSYKLREYMNKYYEHYEIAYNYEGLEEYRAVSVADLLYHGIIEKRGNWDTVTNLRAV